MRWLPRSVHRLGSPPHLYRIAGRAVPWLAGATAASFAAGLYLALAASPPDYQQGESVRILYVHVPAAWMSLAVYVVMAAAGAATLVWRARVADAVAAASAPLGASFTALALATGSLWGKPMWGAWWVWDARLTSELLLLVLYLGYIGLRAAIEDRRTAARASAVLALVGVVNIPVIHFSVEWWNTLHQGATVFRAGGPAIGGSMLAALLVMWLAYNLFYLTVLAVRVRAELLLAERRTHWVREEVLS